ncbi:uncharacterized protein LOC129807698 isoform X2 [Phlebotomus papatasi]|uniref:uncharacterized protein LOC129807698 isoform X2 n=1 Tax=Phlebotomus papatasi TaxID=29031 RepID=UPI002484206B|nr:uncharacterized protein LOC129807698 isoform X2 [Phlebotomus papatasi]
MEEPIPANVKIDMDVEPKDMLTAKMTVETVVPHPTDPAPIFPDQTSTNNTNGRRGSLAHSSQASIISNDNKSSHLYSAPDLLTSPEKKDSAQTEEERVEESDQREGHLRKMAESLMAATKDPAKRRFSAGVILGITQLILSVALSALGGLLIARDASLSSCGSGLWAAAIAAIAGAFGAMGQRARTGFLAASLICVASSTLAMAFTGIGVVRDSQQKDMSNAVSAGSGLLFALALHFLISAASVYYSALKLCLRPSPAVILENSDLTTLTQKKVEDYIKSISSGSTRNGSTIVFPNMLHRNMISALSQSANSVSGRENVQNFHPQPIQGPPPVYLVPAGVSPPIPPPVMYPYSVPYPPMAPPYFVPEQQIMDNLYRWRSTRSLRSRVSERSKSSRRRSEPREVASDAGVDRKAFQYTGLDRAIANSFLVHQQNKSNNCDTSRSGGSQSTESMAKCCDVAM